MGAGARPAGTFSQREKVAAEQPDEGEGATFRLRASPEP
jgi:hypothetical protein